MKVLFVYKSYYPETRGGVEECIHALCLGLTRLGVECAVAVCSANPDAPSPEFPYPVYRFKTTFEAASCPISIDFLKNFKTLADKFDIIHYHFPWPFGDVLQLLSMNKKPYVITYHSDIVRQKYLKMIYEPIMHPFFRGAKKIFATSPPYIQSSPVLQRYKNKTTSIPIGTELSLYPPLNTETMQKWKERVGENFVLFVGVLRYYKGLDYLLEAAKDIKATIVIAGKGPEKEHLESLAKTLKLNHVKFVGFVTDEDKVALLTLCRMVVAPAHLRSEAFCISLLEGLLFNKPLVSTELSTGTSFVNTHDKTGLVVPPADGPALAKAINTLMHDQKAYEQYQAQVRGHYREHFALDNMARTTLTCYEQAI